MFKRFLQIIIIVVSSATIGSRGMGDNNELEKEGKRCYRAKFTHMVDNKTNHKEKWSKLIPQFFEYITSGTVTH